MKDHVPVPTISPCEACQSVRAAETQGVATRVSGKAKPRSHLTDKGFSVWLLWVCFAFQDRFLCVALAVLELWRLRDPLASAFQELWLKACVSTLRLNRQEFYTGKRRWLWSSASQQLKCFQHYWDVQLNTTQWWISWHDFYKRIYSLLTGGLLPWLVLTACWKPVSFSNS